jgi:hypothetical protein
MRFYIWATVVFHFAGTVFEKQGHQKGKITRNFGFYFGKITVKYKKGNSTRGEILQLRFLKV